VAFQTDYNEIELKKIINDIISVSIVITSPKNVTRFFHFGLLKIKISGYVSGLNGLNTSWISCPQCYLSFKDQQEIIEKLRQDLRNKEESLNEYEKRMSDLVAEKPRRSKAGSWWRIEGSPNSGENV